MTALKAPYPYFGGKSKIANIVWERFGRVQNYVEPFFGSGAILLGCPHPEHTETVNDIDALLANFWRALAADPDAVAAYADWPVNEVDLHARHAYLRDRRGLAEELMQDPEKYDAKLAGWWVWGISQWIGSGWCPPAGAASLQMPHLSADGVDTLAVSTQVPRKRPIVAGSGDRTHRGLGGHRESLYNDIAQVRNLSRQIPHLGDAGLGPHRPTQGIYEYFDALSARLRRTRVCCGDWRRVTGPSVTFRHGMTAVFLDPPYAQDVRANVYGYEQRIFEDVRQWAIDNGDNPLLRIALCGYGFEMPLDWKIIKWKAHGGYGGQGNGRGRDNAHREMIAFSPYCLDLSGLPLFANFESGEL